MNSKKLVAILDKCIDGFWLTVNLTMLCVISLCVIGFFLSFSAMGVLILIQGFSPDLALVELIGQITASSTIIGLSLAPLFVIINVICE